MKLYYNARFISMKGEREYSALLVENGRIKECFTGKKSVKKLLDGNTERRDLSGTFVFPGFIDSHTHSFTGGLYTLAADMKNAGTLEEVFERLRRARPVCGRILAWNFDETEVAERRFPSVEELDALYPGTPLLFRRVDGHSCVINSAAYKAIPWKNRPGSETVLRSGTNHQAMRWFHNVDEETVWQAYRAASDRALAAGCTTVHTTIGSRDDLLHFPFIQSRLDRLETEYILYPQVTEPCLAAGTGVKRMGGCLLVDGSFGSGTAALTRDYAGRPGFRGSLYHDDEYWLDLVKGAQEYGLQFAVHAIGDAATAQILRVYKKAGRSGEFRHLIIHNELISEENMDLMKKLGVRAVMQPRFDSLWGGPEGLYAGILGKERALQTNRLASLLKRGVAVAGSSDWYITDLAPLEGIHAAVHMHNPAERLSPRRAVELYTLNAAGISFDEARLGCLEPGYQADMVCLEDNPLTAGSIRSVRIAGVIKRGRRI